jgi:hypothetical protein
VSDEVGKLGPIFDGTVTITGIEESEENSETTEVVEVIGRGERI